MTLRDEILEQPAAARRLLDAAPRPSRDRRRAPAKRPSFAVIAARGRRTMPRSTRSTCCRPQRADHGARDAVHDHALRGAAAHVGRPGDRHLAVGPIAGHHRRARRGAAPESPTVAITNDPGSPLAEAAEHVIDLAPGPSWPPRQPRPTRQSCSRLRCCPRSRRALGRQRRRPGKCARAYGSGDAAEDAARALASGHADRHALHRPGPRLRLRHGARVGAEAAELAQVLALPFSTADFEHGPLALAEPGFAGPGSGAARRVTRRADRSSAPTPQRPRGAAAGPHDAAESRHSTRAWRCQRAFRVADTAHRDHPRSALHLPPDARPGLDPTGRGRSPR